MGINRKNDMTNDYYHNQEAAIAHLAGVGLTFEVFCEWLHKRHPGAMFPFAADFCSYKASELRQYIRENHQLNKES